MDKNTSNMSSESFPRGLMELCNNVGNATYHNLYLLQTVDRDGNITGEAYGMNLMTDTGLNNSWNSPVTANSSDIRKVTVGSGDTDPTLNDTTLTSPLFNGLQATYININESNTPLIYNPLTKIITGRRQVCYCYYDYNISGITTDVEIREIGVQFGNNVSSICTHSLIYDKDGNKSSITKRPNEKLYITLFWTASIHEKLIQDAYDKGLYCFLRPDNFATQPYVNNYSADTWYEQCFARRTIDGDFGSSYSTGARIDGRMFNGKGNCVDHVLTNGYVGGSSFSFLFESNRAYVSGIALSIDNGNVGYYTSIQTSQNFMVTFEELSTPEYMETTFAYTNNYNSLLLSDLFGAYYYNYNDDRRFRYSDGELPVVNFDIQSLSMYNYLTHSWDIEEGYENDGNTDYNNILTRLAGSLWCDLNGKSQTVYVFINDHTEQPITAFNNSGVTLYATDKYWDTSSYEIIANVKNVPEELQTKRYYIEAAGSVQTLSPVRPSKVIHSIKVPKSYYNIAPDLITLSAKGSSDGIDSGCKALSSDEYGWLASYQQIVYLNTTDGSVKSYTIEGPDTGYPHCQNRWSTENGDRLVVFRSQYIKSGSNNYPYRDSKIRVRVYNTTNPDEAPTYTDVTLAFSTTPDNGSSNYPMYTWCDSGILVATLNNDTVILDVYGEDGNTPTQHLLTNAKVGFALNRSNNCVYRVADVTDSLMFEIYDMKEKTVVDNFTIPTDVSYSFAGIAGWKNWIYVRVNASGTYSTFMYDLTKKQLTHLTNLNLDTMSVISSDCDGIRRTDLSVDDCYVFGGIWSVDLRVFRASDPENPILLGNTTYTDDALRRQANTGQLKYVNNGRQLLLAKSSEYGFAGVVDMGWILDNGPYQKYPYSNFKAKSDSVSYYTGSCGLINNGVYVIDNYSSPVKLTWYPIESFVHHKMTGTTRTISAYNNPFRIKGKKFTMQLTNDMSKIIDTSDESTESSES